MFRHLTLYSATSTAYLLLISNIFILVQPNSSMHYKPKHVLVAGSPASGKSEIAKFVSELGYQRVSPDEIATEKFGHTYPFRPNEDVNELWAEFNRRKHDALVNGKDVVVDSVAPDDYSVNYLLWSPVPADRYLISLKVKPETLQVRRQNRADACQHGWVEADLFGWEKDYGDVDHTESAEYTLLIYQNDTPEDLRRIKDDLRRKLETSSQTS